MKTFFLLCVFIPVLNCCSQKTYSTPNDVFESKEIMFYGYDFSHFKLAEPKRLIDGNIKKHIPGWIGFLNEHTNEVDLQKRFKKGKVVFNFDHTLSIIRTLNEEELVSMKKHVLSTDSIQSIINSYSVQEIEGIGFVVIVESFEKEKERCNAYFTFFDIASKQIIMKDYFGSNDADGYGLSNHWGVGLNATFGKYIADIYRKKLRRSTK